MVSRYAVVGNCGLRNAQIGSGGQWKRRQCERRAAALPTCRNAFFCWLFSRTSVSKNSIAATKGMRHNNSPISSPRHVQMTSANRHAPARSFVIVPNPPPYFVYVQSVTPLTSVNIRVNARDEILPFKWETPSISHAAASSRFLLDFVRNYCHFSLLEASTLLRGLFTLNPR